MPHLADAENPTDSSAAAIVEKATGEAFLETQDADPSTSVRESGIGDFPHKEDGQETPIDDSTAPLSKPSSGEQIQRALNSEQEVQSPTEDVKTSGGQGTTEEQNGDASGNIRIPDDAELSKPVREDTTERELKKPVRRSSTFATVMEKFRPRGRVALRSAAPHHRDNHGGGCVIY